MRATLAAALSVAKPVATRDALIKFCADYHRSHGACAWGDMVWAAFQHFTPPARQDVPDPDAGAKQDLTNMSNEGCYIGARERNQRDVPLNAQSQQNKNGNNAMTDEEIGRLVIDGVGWNGSEHWPPGAFEIVGKVVRRVMAKEPKP
jgi:hypothetical protein